MTLLDGLVGPIVKDALADYGTLVTFASVTNTFNATTQSSTDSTTTYSVRAAIGTYGKFQVDGTTIQANDAKMTIAADALTALGAAAPKIGDRVTWFGETGEVKSVRPIASGDMIAAYEVQVRR